MPIARAQPQLKVNAAHGRERTPRAYARERAQVWHARAHTRAHECARKDADANEETGSGSSSGTDDASEETRSDSSSGTDDFWWDTQPPPPTPPTPAKLKQKPPPLVFKFQGGRTYCVRYDRPYRLSGLDADPYEVECI
jgi:hypothetical protein